MPETREQALTRLGQALARGATDAQSDLFAMHAGQLAEQFLADHPNGVPTWPDGENQPTQYEITTAIVLQRFDSMIDHAVAWADFSVSLVQIAPGDHWSVISHEHDVVWRQAPAGDRATAAVAYQIEVAMRAIVIHTALAGHTVPGRALQPAFEAIDGACDNDDLPSTAEMARIGLRAMGLDGYIR